MMRILALALLLLLAACRGGPPATSPAALRGLPACRQAMEGEFPIYPGANEEPALRTERRTADGIYVSKVFAVDRPFREVLSFYVKCLGRSEDQESEEGTRHFKGARATLSLSGAGQRTTIRVSQTRALQTAP